jgi:uncharacterized protein YfdQ (DUF2303 family)
MDHTAVKEINAQSTLKELNTSILSESVAAAPNSTEYKDLFDFREERRWRSGTFTTASVGAFCKYVAYKDIGNKTHVFISMDVMDADAIFNLEGNDGKPLRGDDRAKLRMKMTPQAKALNALAQSTWGREDLSAWMEEWGSFVEFYDSEGGAVTIAKAINAIRKMTVEQTCKVESQIGGMKHTKSSLDDIEAKGAEVTIHGFRAHEFKYYEELPSMPIDVKFDMITRGDDIRIKPRVIGDECNKLALREELANALIEEITCLEHVYLGSFSR